MSAKDISPVVALQRRAHELKQESKELEGIDIPQSNNLNVLAMCFRQAADYLASQGWGALPPQSIHD